MDELESQIAKIQLGSSRLASSFVYVLTEKAVASEAELYIVAELPLLNPAAIESCEKICLAIGGALKRVYKKPLTSTSFELAIAQINEELGKLASMGQVHWINKLNCIIGVKAGSEFTIATCGKVAAFLFRAGEFTDISCSPAQSHPLKTFENYSTGRIRLGDLLILSTTQLFNYISMDRVKTVLSGGEFLRATQTIIELLKDNGGPEVAFGTILNLQVPPGQTEDNEVDLENYIVETPSASASWFSAALEYIKNMLSPATQQKRKPSTALPGVSSSGNKMQMFKSGARGFANKSKSAGLTAWNALGRGAAAGLTSLKPQNFRQLSPEKRLLLISLGVLLVAVVLSLGVAVRLKKSGQQNTAAANQLKQVQTLLNNAQTSFLYNDQNSAQDYLSQAQKAMPAANSVPSGSKTLYQTVSVQLTDLENKIEKQTNAQVTNLGTLAAGSSLIKLPNILGVETNGGVVSYSLTTNRIEDGAIKVADKIISNTYTANTTAAIYTGSSLRLWNFSTNTLSAPFTSNVPGQSDAAGLAYYPTNTKIYLINKKTAQIMSYVVFGGSISKPTVSVSDPSLSTAQDLAIDSAIYVLTGNGIKKFQSGKPASFTISGLVTPLSGSGKIYTEKDFQNLYVLDTGNNRIIIFDKKGNVLSTLQSSQFTKLVDFSVDEKNKTIYVLNDSSLLKVALP